MDHTEPSDFATVVDWAPPSEAERQWASWLGARPATASSLDLARDVLVDTGRTSRGDQRRYSVRRAAIRD